MNHNMPGCIAKFKDLLGENFPILGLQNNGEAASNTLSIMHDYEIGGASTDDFVAAILPFCHPGTTREEVLDAWVTMHGGIPADRLQMVYELHRHYPIYLLSNNNQEHWRDVMERYFSPELHQADSPYNLHPISDYFDGLFLSHIMRIGKPDQRIFQESDCQIAEDWASLGRGEYHRENTIFVDDLLANRKAAEAFGWQACASLDELLSLLNKQPGEVPHELLSLLSKQASHEENQETLALDQTEETTPAVDAEGFISAREKTVLTFLRGHNIPFTNYIHPEGKTIEEAKRWWHNDGSVHCKNLFFRNHKGNVHYLVCFDCDHDLAIHDLEHRLKASLQAAGLPAPGKLSFASPERMMRYLGLEPGSVSPFGLINDQQHEVILFLDKNLLQATSLSFHPNDCRGTVVISREAFEAYLQIIGNKVEYLELY